MPKAFSPPDVAYMHFDDRAFEGQQRIEDRHRGVVSPAALITMASELSRAS